MPVVRDCPCRTHGRSLVVRRQRTPACLRGRSNRWQHHAGCGVRRGAPQRRALESCRAGRRHTRRRRYGRALRLHRGLALGRGLAADAATSTANGTRAHAGAGLGRDLGRDRRARDLGVRCAAVARPRRPRTVTGLQRQVGWRHGMLPLFARRAVAVRRRWLRVMRAGSFGASSSTAGARRRCRQTAPGGRGKQEGGERAPLLRACPRAVMSVDGWLYGPRAR